MTLTENEVAFAAYQLFENSLNVRHNQGVSHILSASQHGRPSVSLSETMRKTIIPS